MEPSQQFYVDITSDVLLMKRDFKATPRTTGVRYSILNFDDKAATDLVLCSTSEVPLGVVMSRTPTGEVYIVFRGNTSTGYRLGLNRVPQLSNGLG